MKSLFAIVRRYMFLAFALIFLIVFLNIALLIRYGIKYQSLYTPRQGKNGVVYFSDSLQKKDGHYSLPKEAAKRLKNSDFIFAMEIDENGKIIWDYRLPKKLRKTYSLSDVASMARWYLADYPVQIWANDYGIFVAGQEKGSIWKLNISKPIQVMEDSMQNIGIALALNMAGIFFIFLFIGWKLFQALKPIAKGIDKLSSQEKISLPEKGITADLSRKINQASRILERQKNRLNARDMARTNWISGVSHDIRTPLSMIMGYTDILQADPSMGGEQIEKLNLIQSQGIRIKELIEDLNLTSKLEYDMQPLRRQPYRIGSLLREIVSEYYNNGLPDIYPIYLDIDDDAEQLTLNGDRKLLKRAFLNLTGNSIRHNPGGCSICLSAKVQKNCCCLIFSDTGCGIPAEITLLAAKEKSEKEPPNPEGSPHILGLILVRQIIQSHGGRVNFFLKGDRANTVELLLPLS